jgi:hypothetical protein
MQIIQSDIEPVIFIMRALRDVRQGAEYRIDTTQCFAACCNAFVTKVTATYHGISVSIGRASPVRIFMNPNMMPYITFNVNEKLM